MNASDFLDVARRTGVEIAQEDDAVFWRGQATGGIKPAGPLAGKKVAVVVAAEFSDFQAYELCLYMTEFGADLEFLGVDWVTWKNTRPTSTSKGVQGMWGLSLDPIPTIGKRRHSYRPFSDANAEDYDIVVVPGGHSADLLMGTPRVLEFLKEAAASGTVLGAIGGGSLPLVSAGILNDHKCTGNRVVSYLLAKVGDLCEQSVARDHNIVTARDTEDTAAFVRELCRVFAPDFVDRREGVLRGKRVVIIAGEDFEDVELVVPVLELLYRGADVTLATFPAPRRARPPLLGLDVVLGNFGVSVPLQEIPNDRYRIVELASLSPDQVDLFLIPGAFCPWNMVQAEEPLDWLRDAAKTDTLISAICHGAIPLAAADLVRGRRIAGVGVCRDHVNIMGGRYDSGWSAVVDGKMVTGRVPSDVPEYLDAVTYALLRT